MAEPHNGEFDEEYGRYCRNVGYLFTAFAQLENVLASALKLHLAFNIATPEDNLAIGLSSAIYGSMRFKASRDTIKRLLGVENSSKERTAFIESLFEQVGHIEAFRDKIAHQFVRPAHSDLGAFWQVSDAITTRDVKKLKFWVFDTESVFLAGEDLVNIANIFGKKPINNRLLDQLSDFSRPAWRYKPSMLKLVPHSKLNVPP